MWQKLPAKRHKQGFTLLEVLVALTVFAIVTALAYKGLDSIATTRQRLDQEMRMWRRIELVFDRLNLDVTQVAPRTWKNPAGKEISPVLGTTSTSGSECQLDIVRFGSDHVPIHLRYRLQKDNFILDLVPDADTVMTSAGGGTHYGSNVLLEHVERCDMAFMDAKNNWQSHWPLSTAVTKERPRGIRLRLTLTGQGQFERMYYLP